MIQVGRDNWKTYLFLMMLGHLVFSCVPTKKLAYLQAPEGLDVVQPYDAVTNSYPLKKIDYLLQPNDVISLRVASITEDQYNFIKQYEEDLGIIRKLNQYDQGQMIVGQQGNMNQMFGGGIRGEEGGGFPTILLDRQNTGFVLDQDGNLELPQIGTAELAGLTIPEAELKIKEMLQGFFETPMVRIQLLNYHFTIVGEVVNEGRFTSFDPEINIFDAITLAGNLTEFADRANIKIIRMEDNQSKVIYLNALDEKTLNAENFYLRRGDLIIVPPLDARTASMYTLPNASRALGIVSAALSLAALIISLGR